MQRHASLQILAGGQITRRVAGAYAGAQTVRQILYVFTAPYWPYWQYWRSYGVADWQYSVRRFLCQVEVGQVFGVLGLRVAATTHGVALPLQSAMRRGTVDAEP